MARVAPITRRQLHSQAHSSGDCSRVKSGHQGERTLEGATPLRLSLLLAPAPPDFPSIRVLAGEKSAEAGFCLFFRFLGGVGDVSSFLGLTCRYFFWWEHESSFIAGLPEKKKCQSFLAAVFAVGFFPFLAFLIKILLQQIFLSCASPAGHRNGDESSHPALPAAAAGAALAWYQDPPLAEHSHPLRIDRQAHRAGEAGQIQPSLSWIPAQEKLAAEALWPPADRGGGCCPKQEELSRAYGASGNMDALVLAQPTAAYLHHHGRAHVQSSLMTDCCGGAFTNIVDRVGRAAGYGGVHLLHELRLQLSLQGSRAPDF